MSNPSQPELVTQFGDAPGADNELRPRQPQNESVAEYRQAVWQPANRTARLRNPPGNAHSVQPSPDGKHVYVGAKAYGREPGGIDIWDVSDFDASTHVAHIDPPDIATVLSKAEQEAAASEKRLSPFDSWEQRLFGRQTTLT